MPADLKSELLAAIAAVKRVGPPSDKSRTRRSRSEATRADVTAAAPTGARASGSGVAIRRGISGSVSQPSASPTSALLTVVDTDAQSPPRHDDGGGLEADFGVAEEALFSLADLGAFEACSLRPCPIVWTL